MLPFTDALSVSVYRFLSIAFCLPLVAFHGWSIIGSEWLFAISCGYLGRLSFFYCHPCYY